MAPPLEALEQILGEAYYAIVQAYGQAVAVQACSCARIHSPMYR